MRLFYETGSKKVTLLKNHKKTPYILLNYLCLNFLKLCDLLDCGIVVTLFWLLLWISFSKKNHAISESILFTKINFNVALATSVYLVGCTGKKHTGTKGEEAFTSCTAPPSPSPDKAWLLAFDKGDPA